MDKPSKKLLRCAIYTRKSTERNLDLEFNSRSTLIVKFQTVDISTGLPYRARG